VGKELDLDVALQPLTQERVHALLVTTDPVFESQRQRIVALAAQHAVPTIYALREVSGARDAAERQFDRMMAWSVVRHRNRKRPHSQEA
jgi:hypothetical protein